MNKIKCISLPNNKRQNLKDETATIYAMNLKDNEVIMLYDYQPYWDISYTPVSTGMYKIIARLSTGDIIDLTPNSFVETSFSLTEENNNGLIFLNKTRRR